MRTLTVVTDDRWLNNDIIEQMMELEERRVDYETQQRFLESVFPEGSAHFDYREYGRGTSRNQRRAALENRNGQVRKGNRTDLSDAETSVYDESRVKKYSLRSQTDTPEFQRWFKDSEVGTALVYQPIQSTAKAQLVKAPSAKSGTCCSQSMSRFVYAFSPAMNSTPSVPGPQ